MSSKTLVKKLVVLAGALTVLGTGSVAFADEHGSFYFYPRALGMKADTAKITVTPAPLKADTAKITVTPAPLCATTPNNPHKPFGYLAQLTRC